MRKTTPGRLINHVPLTKVDKIVVMPRFGTKLYEENPALRFSFEPGMMDPMEVKEKRSTNFLRRLRLKLRIKTIDEAKKKAYLKAEEIQIDMESKFKKVLPNQCNILFKTTNSSFASKSK